MPTNLLVQLVSKITLQDIDGIPYCVWGYRISWTVLAPELKGRIGLIFSSRLDIKDPASYPGVQAIQGTRVLKVTGDDKQYVFQDVDPSKTLIVDLFFLAPCAEDSFTPVLLGTEIPESGHWQFLQFQTEVGVPSGQTQTIRGPAFVFPLKIRPAAAQELDNISRRVPKATLVSLQLGPQLSDFGGALLKFGFLNQLSLQPGEVEAAHAWLVRGDDPNRLPGQDARPMPIRIDGLLSDALKTLEGSPIPSQLPSPSVFASAPAPTLQAFGMAIVQIRQEAYTRLKQQQLVDGRPNELLQAPLNSEAARALNMLNAASVATKGFAEAFKITPIGLLNLERIEMTPVGIERGELVATIPLAPLEKTAVVHKEWSVTSKEFTSIVTDSLENYSETGVTENTELAQSTTSQTSHNNQFNVNGTVTGNYVGIVTSSVASGFTAQDQQSDSATESRQHAISTTRKASSRVKQEHKVTISTTTVTGTSETSTRVLENSSPTDPIRIDYFSMMRKWHVGLYRYGIRLTYDIAIPEPGAAMRKVYADIDNLKNQVGPFVFDVSHQFIAHASFEQLEALADKYQSQLPPPLTEAARITKGFIPAGGGGIHFIPLDIDVPKDFQISTIHATIDITPVANLDVIFSIATRGETKTQSHTGGNFSFDLGDFLKGATGPQTIIFEALDAFAIAVTLAVDIEVTVMARKQWEMDVWNALYNAAQTQYYAKQQAIAAQIAALEDKIANVDTLTLRREENEEIMKCVLRWMLGPNFHFMPNDVYVEFINQSPLPIFNPNGNMDLIHGTVLDATRGDGLNVTAQGWYPMFMYQEMVKFINEAIEWENVLYFLYSYFWDVPPSWDFVRQLRHSDPTRQAFLRAGSARVVLTVRPGWEEAWVEFVEAGASGLQPGQKPDWLTNHAYMSIAEEIHNYAQTNYPGIPPANPGGGPLPDSGAYASSLSSDTLAPSGGNPVTIEVKSSEGFLVGYTAILDSYEPTVVKNGKNVTAHQEAQKILAVPDATHITVERIDNPHDGSTKPFPVMQAGEKGQLIAEWFEYTPTSGTDIAVTSNLATIA
jgi:hypothetical protein